MSAEKKNFIVIKQSDNLNYYICRRCGCEWVSKREDNYDSFTNKHFRKCPGCETNTYETLRDRLDESQLQVLDKLEKDPRLFETEAIKSDCRGPLVTCEEPVQNLTERFRPYPADSMRITDPYEDISLSEQEDFNLWLRLTFDKNVCDLTEEQFKLYQETYTAILTGFKEKKDNG